MALKRKTEIQRNGRDRFICVSEEAFCFLRFFIIEEYPLTLECKVRSWGPETGYLIGEVVASQAEESILTDGKVDLGKLKPIIFDLSFNAYRVVGEIVGKAFSDGLKLK